MFFSNDDANKVTDIFFSLTLSMSIKSCLVFSYIQKIWSQLSIVIFFISLI